MAITNLSGYRWKPNTTITITSAATYDIQGVVEGGGNTDGTTFETTNFELIRIYRLNNFSGEYEYFIALSLKGGYFTNAQSPYYWGLNYSSSSYPTTLNITYTDRNATITFKGGADLTNATLISWLEANGTLEKVPVLQLAPFLTNIANAIRTKKGTTDTINAQNFASEIESIESGGGGLVGYSGTINYYSGYQGEHILVIHSDFTIQDFSVDEYPIVNHTLEDVILLILMYSFNHDNGGDSYMEITNLEKISSCEAGASNSASNTYNYLYKPTANDFSMTGEYSGGN